MPFLQRRRCNGPGLAAVSVLALLAVYDASVAVTSRSRSGAGTSAVHAYARPPSYASRSRCPAGPSSGRCTRIGGRKLHGSSQKKLACDLRCGGTANDILPMRGTSSLFVSNSGSADIKKSSSKYHLIWSPNFWKKLIVSAAFWLAIQYALRKQAVGLDKILSPPCHGEPTTAVNGIQRVITSVLLPLLSSSCCAIQLMINALSGWGCAGFNTYLGPIRPVLLPLLLMSTWSLLPQRSLGWTAISLLLAFLPEIVDIWNTIRSQQWQQNQTNGKVATTTTSLPVTAKLRLDIPTMGCVACVNKIDTSIRQIKSAANIREETSWLNDGSSKGGGAELQIQGRTSGEIDEIAKEVVSAVKDAGFQCDVESLRVNKV